MWHRRKQVTDSQPRLKTCVANDVDKFTKKFVPLRTWTRRLANRQVLKFFQNEFAEGRSKLFEKIIEYIIE